MKKIIVGLLALSVSGCAAKPEEMAAYYQALETTNKAILSSLESQRVDNQLRRTATMSKYSTAISLAASTQSPTDDVLVAFAWGHAIAQKDEILTPDLKAPAAPVTDVDRIRAWTPLISALFPIVYPLVYGLSFTDTDTFSASGNGKINIASQNAGSLNTAGGNQTINTTDNKSEEVCYQCDLPEVVGVGTETIDNCLTSPPGGYGPGGTPLWEEGCSCISHFVNQDC